MTAFCQLLHPDPVSDRGTLYGWQRAVLQYGQHVPGGGTAGAVRSRPDDGGVDMKCPTRIAITYRREAELAKAGLMHLSHWK